MKPTATISYNFIPAGAFLTLNIYNHKYMWRSVVFNTLLLLISTREPVTLEQKILWSRRCDKTTQ